MLCRRCNDDNLSKLPEERDLGSASGTWFRVCSARCCRVLLGSAGAVLPRVEGPVEGSRPRGGVDSEVDRRPPGQEGERTRALCLPPPPPGEGRGGVVGNTEEEEEEEEEVEEEVEVEEEEEEDSSPHTSIASSSSPGVSPIAADDAPQLTTPLDGPRALWCAAA